MKNLSFFTILSLAVLAFGGCQNAANNAANATANKTTANGAAANTANNNTAASNSGNATQAQKGQMEKVDLSGVDTSKPMSADELKEKYMANPDDWKGKQVAVTGLYKSYATSDGVNAASASRTDLKDKGANTSVGCFSEKRPEIWDDFSKNYQKYEKEKIVVKGVVAGTVDYGDGAFVGLEPCEIVTK